MKNKHAHTDYTHEGRVKTTSDGCANKTWALSTTEREIGTCSAECRETTKS